MLYSEFIENTKGKDNMLSYYVYKALESVYMEHDEVTKTDVYRKGRKVLEDLMNTTGEPAEL